MTYTSAAALFYNLKGYVMYKYSDLKSVHLELTTKCNAMCPQCARTINGGKLNPVLELSELNISDIARIFPTDFLRQLKSIALCGNYGDPLVTKDLVAICRYFKYANPSLELELHTNGGLRSSAVWLQLAKLIDCAVFAIDGLEDTNHIYRQHTIWSNIMNNAHTFISNGGKAEWHFLIFKHNEHQIEDASKLAEHLGFSAFRTKRTGRFVKNGKLLPYFPILNSEGIETGKLEMPSVANSNAVAQEIDPEDYAQALYSADIHCLVAESKSIYVSARGHIFPCCWLGQIVPVNRMSSKKEQILALIDRNGGLESINAKTNSIESIIKSNLFQKSIPEGWNKNVDRLKICANQCGKFQLTEAQNDWHPVWLKL